MFLWYIRKPGLDSELPPWTWTLDLDTGFGPWTSILDLDTRFGLWTLTYYTNFNIYNSVHFTMTTSISLLDIIQLQLLLINGILAGDCFYQ